MGVTLPSEHGGFDEPGIFSLFPLNTVQAQSVVVFKLRANWSSRMFFGVAFTEDLDVVSRR